MRTRLLYTLINALWGLLASPWPLFHRASPRPLMRRVRPLTLQYHLDGTPYWGR